MKQFKVKLRAVHQASGLTAYAVAKLTNVAINTVKRYAENEEVVLAHVPPAVVTLAEFYGVDWRDPKVVEVIEGGASTPEMQTALLPA